MPSHFDSMGGSSSSALSSSSSGIPSHLDGKNGSSNAPSGAGMPSYADGLSGGGGGMKQSSYMPKSKSYKESSGSGMPSYFDSMGSAWGTTPGPATAVPPPALTQTGYKTKSPPPNRLNRLNSDQAAQLVRVASPARGGPGPGNPLANLLGKPHPLKCDQTMIMREGEAFLPHAMDPVIKRGNLEPDQSSSMRYFFTGRLCASEPFRPIPMESRFPSDQERADNHTRQSLMYFQNATRKVPKNPKMK
jgi:hypothetical protein